jgi:hypothetical protein
MVQYKKLEEWIPKLKFNEAARALDPKKRAETYDLPMEDANLHESVKV